MAETGAIAEVARSQSRLLIADVLHPFSFLNNVFTRLQNDIKSGDLQHMITSTFVHGATMMLEEVKSHCPVDEGDLRESLYVSTEDKTKAGAGHRGITTLSVQNEYAYITTESDYAYYLEYGTVNMPAHPFMRPGFDSAYATVFLSIADVVVTNVLSGFWGRVAVDVVDVGLKHASPVKQKTGVVRDLAGVAVGHAAGYAIGRVARKAGSIVGIKQGPKSSGKANRAAGRAPKPRKRRG
jgi:HK97 gp10 family phage protein